MEKRHLFIKTDKTFIVSLPRFTFDGKIVVVQSERETRQAIDYLSHCDIVGFDTETRPSFQKGVVHKVALLQISSENICFLFRLCMTGLMPEVIRFLSDKNIIKVGLSLSDDFMMLKKRAVFTPGGFIDLQTYVREMGIEDQSLQKIYANLFHQRISKRAQLRNWEADVLDEAQKLYAATDAYACLKLYKELRELRSTGAYVLEQPVIVADTACPPLSRKNIQL